MQIIWSGFQRLNETNVKINAPSVAGIYLMWVQLETEKWRCYYVGQADNIQERLLDHCSQHEQNNCIKNKVQNRISGFEYAKISKQSDRDGAEKYLFDHYKPECNEQDPGGLPIQVNLP